MYHISMIEFVQLFPKWYHLLLSLAKSCWLDNESGNLRAWYINKWNVLVLAELVYALRVKTSLVLSSIYVFQRDCS